MSDSDSKLEFSDQLIAIQRGLYVYILTLLPWPQEASDVLQQTNLVLWRDADRFEPGTDFRAWAYRVAYFQVLDHRRKKQRNRLSFDDALLKSLAEQVARRSADDEEEALALRDCLKKLSDDQRELIGRRYDAGVSVKKIAADLQQSPTAVAVRLHRIRQALLDCMQRHSAERQGD